MFLRTRTQRSTEHCWEQIEELRAALESADAVVVGAGAGLSASAGLTYSGERFTRYFGDFAEKYGIRDMYSGGFYPFPTEEEHWAWWSRHIYYNRYVDNCIDSGFDVDYNRSDDVFSADNTNGDSLRVEYEGFQTMSISIYAADEETDSAADHTTDTPEPGATSETEPEPSTSEDSSTPDDSEIRPEFKETMDSYGAFFDTYVSFMTEYANTDDPSAMLIDYLAYLEEYTEMMEQLDAIDETELTTAELLYYSEVMSRISQKLLTVD